MNSSNHARYGALKELEERREVAQTRRRGERVVSAIRDFVSSDLRDSAAKELSGGDSGGEPPVPIPNTEVKPLSADGTALAGE